jgi:hypothetical protein
MSHRFLLATTLAATLTAFAHAQLPTPTIVDLPGFTTISGNANLSQDGGFTATASASGVAGQNPGWTLFTYGTNGGPSNERLRINAPSTDPASTQYLTSIPTNQSVAAAPLGFSVTTAYAWTIINAATGTNASLQVSIDDNNLTTYLPLNNTGNLASYNARLNDVFKFNSSEWIDPNTNAPISASVGTFSYTFSNFDPAFSGGRYRGIDLVYTPVPEPLFALAAAGLAFGLIRRRCS